MPRRLLLLAGWSATAIVATAAQTKAFAELAEGGTVQMALTEAPWGTAGWLKDKFGITWNVDITK